MKKIGSIILSLFMFICLSLTLTDKVYAKSFEIRTNNSTYQIQKNGDVKVTELLTYNFKGDYNGILRDLDPSGSDGIEGVEVYLVEKGGTEKQFSLAEYAYNGDNDVFTFKEGVYPQIKIYSKSSYEEKTFKIVYTMKNLAILYNDTAEFNRMVYDSKWAVPTKLVNVTVIMPADSKDGELKTWTHGKLTGYDQILDKKTVKITASNMNPGETIESHIVFSKELLIDSKRKINEDALPRILKKEAVNAKEANAKREKAKKEYAKELERQKRQEELKAFGAKFTPFLVALSALGFGFGVMATKKLSKELLPTFTGDYYRELPEDYTPAVMGYLVNKTNVKTQDLMATLMNLTNKGFMKVESHQVAKERFLGGPTYEEDVTFVATNEGNYASLPNHEQFVYTWFMVKLATNGRLNLDELQKMLKNKTNAIKFSKDYKKFQEEVERAGSNQNFFMTSNNQKAKGSGIVILVLILLGILSIVFFKNFWGILMIAVAVIIAIMIAGAKFKLKFTQRGIDHYTMWMAFKKFLLTFSKMDKAQVPAITIWNHYLVYATSLGVAKEVIDQLPEVYPMEEIQNEFGRMGSPYIYSNSRVFNSIDNSISSAVERGDSAVRAQEIASSRSSSSSGGGGGFSSGSSGGSGGGGGGGAF